MRVFRIYPTSNKKVYMDYLAVNNQDAFNQYRKETGRTWCYEVRLLKDARSGKLSGICKRLAAWGVQFRRDIGTCSLKSAKIHFKYFLA